MRANLPNKDYFIDRTLPARSELTIIEWKNSGNNAHLFRGYSQVLKRDLACKIIPRANLLFGPNQSELWREEVHKADVLRNSSVVRFEGIEEWKDPDAGIDCVVLISAFIDGPCLRDFLRQQKETVNVAFICDWLSTMLNLFNEMKEKNITHGDFHTGNILVEDQSSYNLIGPQYVFRVTDFGVAEATSDHRFKDDYQQLASVLQQLLQAVKYADETQKDKFIFKTLRDHFVGRHLMETDPTRDPLARQPAELLKRLQELDAEFARSAEAEPDHLMTPFDFLSCEQIGHAPALLHALYSDRFLGLPEIESQNNVVVTGPRGCGKTTVFRSQSLDQKLLVNDANPDDISYIGVYYRCDDLYFAFPRYKLPDRDAAVDIPVHFVTATLIAKLIDSIDRWGRQYFATEFGRAEARTAERLWNALKLPIPQTPGYATLKAVYAAANKERLKAAERHRFANDAKRSLGYCFGPDVLASVCEVLNDLSFVRSRPIFFFIDDYSMPKVTKDLQANLNRVFMQRTSVCFFKLSTESSVSFVKNDIDNKTYVESREFVLQNLGLVYLHTGVTPKLSFEDSGR